MNEKKKLKLKIKLANVLKIKNKFTDKLHLPDTQLLWIPATANQPTTPLTQQA